MIAALAIAASLLGAPASQEVAAAAIERAVRERVQAQLADAGSAATVRVAGRLADQPLPAGTATIEVGRVAGPLPRARLGVPVRLLVDGRLARTLTVWLALEDRRPAWVYGDRHAEGEQVGTLRAERRIVDMTCCGGEALQALDGLDTLRFARAVRAGAPVMRDDFEAVPAVVAQAAVEIEVAQGAVRLSTTGIALGDARVGELVPVRPANSRSAVSSRVVGIQKVRIE